MLQDTDFFEKLETWLTLGDVLPTVTWRESVSPDERYEVAIEFRFRSKPVGEASFVIEPIVGTENFRLWWINLIFKDDWQNKGLYTELVKILPPNLKRYGIVETVADPRDKDAERRLASQGFEWVGHSFTLDHS